MSLFTLPRQVPVQGGNTFAGALAYFYAAGTTTPETVYTNSARTVAHSNPVVADANGVFPAIYTDPTKTYRVRVTTATGVLLQPDEDPYPGNQYAEAIETTVTAAYIGEKANPRTTAEIAAGVTPTAAGYAYPPGDVRRYGAVGNGTTDDTAAVVACIAVSASHRAVFQPATYLTGKFTVPAGGSIYLPPGCVLKDNGVLGTNERFVNITNDNVHIQGWGAKVDLNAAYTTGEQRHGVFIYGAHNVTIEGLESSRTGGDGFYIGGDSGDPATNVTLIGVKADANRRQGISLVSGRRVRIVDPILTNTSGTAPSAGIDIEPNATTDVLEDISVVRPRCVGNDGPGIEIFLANWNSTANYCDIDIIEPYTRDNGNVSVGGRYRPGIDINRIPSTTPCRGVVRIVDAQCIDETVAGIHVYNWDINGPVVKLVRPLVVNPNQIQGSTSSIHGGIILYNDGAYTTTPGNVRIDNPLIRDDDGYLNANSLAPIRISAGWDDVEVQNPRVSYAGTNFWSIDADAREVRLETITPSTFAAATSTTVTDGRYIGRTITNTGASGAVVITLIAATAARVGWRMRFEVTAAQDFRIDPNGTDLIRGGTAGQYLQSNTIGDHVEIECGGAGTWKIVSQYGTWTFA